MKFPAPKLQILGAFYLGIMRRHGAGANGCAARDKQLRLFQQRELHRMSVAKPFTKKRSLANLGAFIGLLHFAQRILSAPCTPSHLNRHLNP